MTTFHIKLIAVITMAIDHIGAFLLPELFFLRIVGRLSFILFAWLLANGAIQTRNMGLYMQRLFFFALVSEIPYLLIHRTHDPNSWELNIFFTLFLGLVSIYVLQRSFRPWLKLILIVGITLLAEKFTGGFSYGAYGVVSILIFYLFHRNLKIASLLQVLAIIVFYTVPALLSGDSVQHLFESYSIPLIQPVGLLSILIIAAYNGLQGSKEKVLFYVFYPLHLSIIYILMTQR